MNTVSKLIRPDLRKFSPYSSARDESKQGKVWLNANELPWNHDWAEQVAINRYPEKQPQYLLQRLSEILAVEPEQIGLFRGSDEAIDLLTRLFCRAEKDAIMICPPTFGMYAVSAQLQGAHTIQVPLNKAENFQLDVEAIMAHWTKAVKIIYLCTPNNPTGGSIAIADVLALCHAFSGKSMIVVDEAYIDFSRVPSLSSYINQYDNLAVLRTFSKAYGLAGARCGLLLAQAELITWLCAIVAPYPLSSLTIAALEKTLSPQQLQRINEKIQMIIQERDELSIALAALPVIKKIWPSDANFLLVEVVDANAVMQQCQKRGIVLRYMGDRMGLENCLRITIGTPEENLELLHVFQQMREK